MLKIDEKVQIFAIIHVATIYRAIELEQETKELHTKPLPLVPFLCLIFKNKEEGSDGYGYYFFDLDFVPTIIVYK